MSHTRHPYLIIGGSSHAGQAVIRAVRRHAPGARILATTTRAAALADVDDTIGGVDLNAPGAAEQVRVAVLERTGAPHIDTTFFTPSMGPVGYPACVATPGEVEQALRFSVTPLLELARIIPGRVISFSAFYWLPHIAVGYGAMTAAKRTLESLAVRLPRRFGVIRSGVFYSRSLRGIMLAVRRGLRGPAHVRIRQLEAIWKRSNLSFEDFFLEYAHGTERAAYAARFPARAHSPTTDDDLAAACVMALRQSVAPIINVIGSWLWSEDELPALHGDDASVVEGPVREALERYAPVFGT